MKDGNTTMGSYVGQFGTKVQRLLVLAQAPTAHTIHGLWSLDDIYRDAQTKAHKWQIGLQADMLAWASIYYLASLISISILFLKQAIFFFASIGIIIEIRINQSESKLESRQINQNSN